MEIAFILILLLVTMIFFSFEILSFDMVVLLAIVIMVVSGIITAHEAFEGFGNDYIFMLISIFIIGSSLQHNGIIDFLSEKITGLKTISTGVLILFIMIIVGVLSAFMNNTTVAAVFIAPIISVCKKFNISPSKILMPMAFASLMGGTCTLVGTSTNIAGSAYMVSNGIAPLGMFELLPLGAVILVVGIVYMLLIGVRLLPGHKEGFFPTLLNKRIYSAELLVAPGSALIGKKISQVEKESGTINIVNVFRKKPVDDITVIHENDVLLVNADKDDLLKFRNLQKNVLIKKSVEHENSEQLKLAEIMVLPTSNILNLKLGVGYYQQQNRVSILGIHRKNEAVDRRIKDIRIKTGDMMLVEGNDENLQLIRDHSNFIVVSEVAKTNLANLKKGWLTLIIFIIAIIIGSLKIIPLSIAFLITAATVIFIKAVPAQGFYTAVDWRLLILIGGMTAFGTALHKTGADEFLAETIVRWLSGYGKYAMLAGFIVLTALLTQPMSNAAAALVVLPIAIQTAELMHLPVRTFCIAIITTASISMIAPFEPCSLLVFTPGRYKIADFIKTGGLLTLIALLLILWLVPMWWGL